MWLLEHSYESGRAGSSMFFTHAFQFRPVLERFDDYDGPRRLFNYISTLTLLQEDSDTVLSDEHLYTSMQAIRNTCMAFRSYMAAHIFVKVEHLKRTHVSRLQCLRDIVIPSCVHGLPANKVEYCHSSLVQIFSLLNKYTAFLSRNAGSKNSSFFLLHFSVRV
ncbi:unnamed protein product [Brugia timori]|uniref:Uncharacterized protein n=1 Tax=Brugia timori TaxID=42155 RepID=A0A3P7T7V8_9BILA|nr:unnamed protein product [Brugia timori]